MKLNNFSDRRLLKLYSEVQRTLRNKGVLRSSNNPAADYAEKLACERFNLKLADKSTKGYDAKGRGKKYQIKSRRITKENHSLLLGVIRNIRKADFDFLIAYVFNEDFTINKIFKISKKDLITHVKRNEIGWSKANNGHVVNLRSKLLTKYIIK